MRCVVVGIDVKRRLVKLIGNDRNKIRPFWEYADKIFYKELYTIDYVIDPVYRIMEKAGWV